jgi:CubicO group peptidase (beta-lactamase class C family)
MKNFKILSLFLIIPALLIAQRDSTDFIVDSIMQKQKIVGLSLAVIKNGKVKWNKGYGLANVELNQSVKKESVIRISSISKQFFCTAIMKLMEEGKLSIEDSIHKFFPDAPDSWKPIQIKYLMSHSSGLQRESPGYDNFKLKSDLEIIKAAYPLALDFKTGEKYQYCNLGYYILAEIISQVSGINWGQYIQENILEPAGMKNTYVTDFYKIIPNRVNGYMYQKDALINATSLFAIRPSGGFLSTSTDMIKWDKVLREKNIILKKENWEKLWEPFIKMSDNPNSKSYYGFGWITGVYKEHKTIGHDGANIGFRSSYVRYPDDDLSILVLTNTSEANPNAIVTALADYYFRKNKF